MIMENQKKPKGVTYTVLCAGCNVEITINAEPKDEYDWKEIQKRVGMTVGMCSKCEEATRYNDGYYDD